MHFLGVQFNFFTTFHSSQLGMYRISGSYPAIRPIFHWLSGIRFVTQLSGRIPDNGTFSCDKHL